MDDETHEGWGSEIVSTNQLKGKRLFFEVHFLLFVLQQDSFGGIYYRLSIETSHCSVRFENRSFTGRKVDGIENDLGTIPPLRV